MLLYESLVLSTPSASLVSFAQAVAITRYSAKVLLSECPFANYLPKSRPGVRTRTPNPSLKGSTNGGPPGPAWRYAVYFRQSGPGVPPSAPP